MVDVIVIEKVYSDDKFNKTCEGKHFGNRHFKKVITKDTDCYWIDEEGKKVPFNVKVKDKVLMPKYGGTEVKLGDTEYQIMREDDILAVVD